MDLASGVRSVLLVKLRAIGDAVLTLPSLEALRRGFPGAAIHVVCPPAAVGVYAGDPRVASLHPYDRRRLASPAAHLAYWAELRRLEPDLAVCLHSSFRSALLGRISGAPWRSIRNHSGPDWFSNVRATEPKEPKSIIQRDFDALRACGLSPKDERPAMFIPAAAHTAAGRRLRTWGLHGAGLLMFPGAGKAEKRWPLENFLALAKALRPLRRRTVLLTGPGEPGLAAEAKAVGAVWDRVDDLKELGALCGRVGAALGNDSGPRHIAAACGARTFTLFGPETLREWHPYRRRDGHWALQPAQGRVEDLGLDKVLAELKRWLKA
jgi:ADP-heptose:LPS heptosyltransferase